MDFGYVDRRPAPQDYEYFPEEAPYMTDIADALTADGGDGGGEIDEHTVFNELCDADSTANPTPVALELNEEVIEAVRTRRLTLISDPGRATQRWAIEGHPELLARSKEGCTAAEAAAAEMAINDLGANGVHIPPTRALEEGGTTYLVTKKVHGVGLPLALARRPTEKLLSQVDETWKGLCDNLIHCLNMGQPIPMDTTHSLQYMVGRIGDDTEQRVWLVDIPLEQCPVEKPEAFETYLLDVTNELRWMERSAGRSLPKARQAVERALLFCRDSERFGDGIANTIRYVLDRDVNIYLGTHDYLIQLFRTDGARAH